MEFRAGQQVFRENDEVALYHITQIIRRYVSHCENRKVVNHNLKYHKAESRGCRVTWGNCSPNQEIIRDFNLHASTPQLPMNLISHSSISATDNP
jgi:hypothetical protein